MKKKVTLSELLGARIVLAVYLLVFYWYWARNDWKGYYSNITNVLWIFAILFFAVLAFREKKYKKETADELAISNLRRCDSVCLKIASIAIVAIACLCAFLRFSISTEIIGYMLMGLYVLISVVKAVMFYVIDKKGV